MIASIFFQMRQASDSKSHPLVPQQSQYNEDEDEDEDQEDDDPHLGD